MYAIRSYYERPGRIAEFLAEARPGKGVILGELALVADVGGHQQQGDAHGQSGDDAGPEQVV